MEDIEKIEISSLAIKKTLKKFSQEDAVCQYIWNGFDAGATEINLDYALARTAIDTLTTFSIQDNGSGINYHELTKKFKPFYESEKAKKGKYQDFTLRGKDGYGRLTFFKFCNFAQWETTFESEAGLLAYKISINSHSMDSFTKTRPVPTSGSSGTKIEFSGFSDHFHPGFIEKKLVPYILNEFAWYLEINKDKGYKLLINGIAVDYSAIIEDVQEFPVSIRKTIETPDLITFKCYFIQWKSKLNDEFSRFYFLNDKFVLKNQMTTKLNKKGDRFYHSMIIRSNFFNNFIAPEEAEAAQDTGKLRLFYERDDYVVFRELIELLDKYLKDKRRPFLKKYSEILIHQFEREKVFPKFGNNPWDQLKKEEFVALVKELYEVEPALFVKLNMEQKKTFLHLLNLVIDADERENLFKILDDVVRLDARDREELKELLSTTRLSNVIKATKLVHDRILTLSQLKKLVLDHELQANERDHLQRVIEQHYWIFGEQYNMVCAAEVKFEEALRRYSYILKGDKGKQKIDHPDKLKEMDIFLVRQDYQTNQVNNVVVELKSPTSVKRLTQKEFNQVQTYMNTILSVDQFNAGNYFWEFYLIGQDYDDFIRNQLENAQHHGEFGLAFKIKNYKIYVKKWSEVFNEVDLRLQWINQKLLVEKEKLGAGNDKLELDELLEELENSAAIQPGQIRVE
jgi:hypothetical protein